MHVFVGVGWWWRCPLEDTKSERNLYNSQLVSVFLVAVSLWKVG